MAKARGPCVQQCLVGLLMHLTSFFINFRASKSVYGQILCCLEMSTVEFWGSSIVECLVGSCLVCPTAVANSSMTVCMGKICQQMVLTGLQRVVFDWAEKKTEIIAHLWCLDYLWRISMQWNMWRECAGKALSFFCWQNILFGNVARDQWTCRNNGGLMSIPGNWRLSSG